MFIGHLRVTVHIPHSLSLKDKRRVMNKLKARARNTFNISVSEKPSDKWQIGEVSFACINYTKKYVSEMMDNVEKFIQSLAEIQIIEVERDIL